jgi:glycosyltransferase involved in cell wall biosynthesis
VALQTSSEHYGKLDEAARSAIDRLDAINYSSLIQQRSTLSTDEYRAMYDGAICLQPYDPVDFADRVSGVTLDALRAGAPVITTGGTWMANIVKRFNAGVVLQDRSVPSIHDAVEKILSQFSDYQENARGAGLKLESENSAQHLIDALADAK